MTLEKDETMGAVESVKAARRLQCQGQNQGGADILGVQAWEKAISSFWRARPAAPPHGKGDRPHGRYGKWSIAIR